MYFIIYTDIKTMCKILTVNKLKCIKYPLHNYSFNFSIRFQKKIEHPNSFIWEDVAGGVNSESLSPFESKYFTIKEQSLS